MSRLLSDLERDICAAISIDGDSDVPMIAKLTGRRQHKIRYSLNRLIEHGIIKQPRPLIDPSKLGLVEYLVYLTLSADSHRVITAALKYLSGTVEVTSIIRIGGEYQLILVVQSDSPYRVQKILADLLAKTKISVSRRSVIVTHGFSFFGRRYLSKKGSSFCGYNCSDSVDMIDDVDITILNGLSNLEFDSLPELSRQIKISYPTLDRRVRSLRTRGVIVEMIGTIDINRLSIQLWKLVVNAQNVDPKTRGEIIGFCHQNVEVVALLESFGSWDYEIWVEVSDLRSLSGVESKLHRALSGKLHSVKLIPVIEQTKTSEFQSICDKGDIT